MPATDVKGHLTLKPVRVGWLGREWKAFEREIRMAFEEGLETGVLDRPYEFLFEEDARASSACGSCRR